MQAILLRVWSAWPTSHSASCVVHGRAEAHEGVFQTMTDHFDPARVSAQVLNLQLPRPVQFSVAADTRVARRHDNAVKGTQSALAVSSQSPFAIEPSISSSSS